MLHERSGGVLMHISSLPGTCGIGDIGWPAFDFIDFLEKAEQRFWQFLPTVPSDSLFGCSPYMGLSATAGNPLLISLDALLEDELLTLGDLENNKPEFSEYLVDFDTVNTFKSSLLEKAYGRFCRQGGSSDYEEFCLGAADWLEDYALFMALREKYDDVSWNEWPAPLAMRQSEALTEANVKYKERVGFYKFQQYCFFKQWAALRQYANQKGIYLIGDMPIYVSFDSADVWANQDCFKLHKKTLAPTHVAGVPPDYFSKTGQRWGNPIYKWKVKNKKNIPLYTWWRNRFKYTRQLVDVVRIDHFRGFESYWEVPASEKTAVNGKWRKGPGKSFFDGMDLENSQLHIIAEDLGVITPEVEKLRDDLGFPGMKILQFAFDSDSNNYYLPFNYQNSNCIVYTGTHDNDTTLGWYMGEDSSGESKKRAKRYANTRDDGQIHWDFIRMAFASVASVAIVPMQDILGFGQDCRMNTPGTPSGNWRWRCAARFLNDTVSARLKDETLFYGRGARGSNP